MYGFVCYLLSLFLSTIIYFDVLLFVCVSFLFLFLLLIFIRFSLIVFVFYVLYIYFETCEILCNVYPTVLGPLNRAKAPKEYADSRTSRPVVALNDACIFIIHRHTGTYGNVQRHTEAATKKLTVDGNINLIEIQT